MAGEYKYSSGAEKELSLRHLWGPKHIPLQKKEGAPPKGTKRSERATETHFSGLARLSIYEGFMSV